MSKQQAQKGKMEAEQKKLCKTYLFRLYPTHKQRKVLEDVVKRVDRAFEDFFRRVHNAEKPGYPRFRSRSRYDSLTFKQYGNSFHVLPGTKKNRGTLVRSLAGTRQDGDAPGDQREAEDGYCETHSHGKMVCEH